MTDVLTIEQRRLNMSRIRGRDTKLELMLRAGLHARGMRYRLHCRELPGCPDLVLRRFGAAVFINGCFWHGHECPMFKLPATRTEFWAAKIEGNRKRDARVIADLADAGWRTLVLWECALKGKTKRPIEVVVDEVLRWLVAGEVEGVVRGAGISEDLKPSRT